VANIKDVAREAGVSPSTVSRVLRGTKRVDPATRERVLAAVERLGYRPSAAARMLRGDPSHLVGVVVPNMANEFFIKVVHGVEEATAPLGINLIVASTKGDPDKERPILDALIGHRVNGIVLAPSGMAADYVPLARKGPPVVLVDRVVEEPLFDAFVEDNANGARFLVEAARAAGHRVIGVLRGPDRPYPAAERMAGVLAADAPDIVLRPSAPSPWGVEGGRLATRELLHGEPRPTVLISLQNEMTLGALLELKLLGVRVPEDVSVLSYGIPADNPLLYVQVTGLEHQAIAMGRSAGQQLLTRLLGAPHRPRTHVLVPRFVLGQSLAGPDGRDGTAAARALATRRGFAPTAADRIAVIGESS
jgi:LacI family transcriptional regulator